MPFPAMRARDLLLVVLASFGAAVALTWPLATHMTSTLPYDPRFEPFAGSDMNTWAWNFWWARQVVEEGHRPFYCDLIFPPFGHSLALHTHTFLWGLVSVPLQWMGGLLFAVNAMVLVILTATATAAWALAREAGLRPEGALLAAFAWAFSPYFLQKGLVHFNLFASPWMPLALLFLLRWMRATRGAWRPALGLGAVVGLSLLTGSLQTVYLATAAACLVAFAPRGEDAPRRRRALLQPVPLALALGAAVITALPFLVEWWIEFRAVGDLGNYPQEFHPRFFDFFTPSGLHPAFAGLGAGAPVPDAPFDQLRPEHAALYLRVSLLALAGIGAWRVRCARRWAGMFLVLFLLAWDPGPEPEGWLSSLYRDVPPFGLLRVPARFLPAALVGLCIAAGFGLQALRSRPVAVALLAALVFESWTGSYPSAPVVFPKAVDDLAAAPRRGAVLKLPHLPGASVSMLWQTRHELPVTTSYVARVNPDKVEELRTVAPDLFMLLSEPARFLPEAEHPGSVRGLAVDLRRMDVRHILLLETGMADPARFAALLDELEGWEQAERAGDGVSRWYATGY